MSIFTSLVTSVLDVPGEPGHSITIRKLAPKHLDEARKAAQAKSLRDLREMGGPAFAMELQAMQPASSSASTTAPPADPLLLFDRSVLLAHGITDWSLGVELTAATRDDLDEDAAVWLATAILKLAKPSLYEPDTEVAVKNG